jgi:hypothetical protein
MISRMGIIRNIKVMFLASLFLLGAFFIFLSTPASSGGISVWPPDVTINMKDVFPEKEIKFNIQVNNLYASDINVSVRIENQIPYRLGENYTDMPNLSWIKITPNIFNLSAKQSRVLEVTIDIPGEEKPLHYNERWEACIVISEIKDKPAIVSTELAIEIYIRTPEKSEMQMSNLLILLFIVVGFVALTAYILYFKKRKRTFTKKRSVVFYFKKRKLKNK